MTDPKKAWFSMKVAEPYTPTSELGVALHRWFREARRVGLLGVIPILGSIAFIPLLNRFPFAYFLSGITVGIGVGLSGAGVVMLYSVKCPKCGVPLGKEFRGYCSACGADLK